MKKLIFNFTTLFLCCFWLLNSCANYRNSFITEGDSTISTEGSASYINLSVELLKNLKAKKDTKHIEESLANADAEKLKMELNTDVKKMAFWVNIYNAYIQVILLENPGLYENRGDFFKKEQIQIAKSLLSFDKIEHGIIRSSTVKLSKGYLPRIFKGKIERMYGLEERDGRIHFVLNCGAKDCPPVYIFKPSKLNQQFDVVASKFLEKVTEVDEANGLIKTTPLFNWFTGDFGYGKKGIKNLLKKYEIISEKEQNFKIEFKSYDWTLDLENFGAEL